MRAHNRSAALWSLAVLTSSVLTACGGGGATEEAATGGVMEMPAKKGASAAPAPAIKACTLPTTAPAAGVLVRESFGLCTGTRPSRSDGRQQSVFDKPNIHDYWVEYPGSGTTRWAAPQGTQTWAFARVGGMLDPYEAPSVLQPDETRQGAMISEWFDAIVEWPTALVPFSSPASAYQVSMEGVPAAKSSAYVAIGLTGSTTLLSNFMTVGQASLTLRYQDAALGPGSPLTYELRVGTAVVQAGVTSDNVWNQMTLRYDPATRLLSASVNGVPTGDPVSANLAPRFAGFEGVGVLDNFVIRTAP